MFFAVFAQHVHFAYRVAGKMVEHHEYALSEALQVLDVAVKVSQSGTQALFVGFLNFVEFYAAVHFQSLRSGNNYREVGRESALATQNVVEFFSTQVSTEAGFSDGVFSVRQRHLGSNQ